MGRDFLGKSAFVTGGARGLGFEICRKLASHGMTVVIADHHVKQARTAEETLRGEGGDCYAVGVDVRVEADVTRAIDDTIEKIGTLDVLVNNAAIDFTLPIGEMTYEKWQAVIETNLSGPFLTSRRALLQMERQGRGHIINIISTAAKRTWQNASAYHASKWGLLGFTHALHTEARAKNIKTTAVIAGGMRTPFLLDRFPDLDPQLLQDPKNVAATVYYVLTQPEETVIPEITVIPMTETSWP